MIINTTVISNRVRAMANNGSLSVVLCEEHIAATSGKVIYLERPKYDWDKDRLCIWESDAYHEIGHCAPNNKDIFDIIHKHEIHMGSRFGKCLNCLDDLRQEWEQYGKFRGRDRIMGEGNMLVFKGHVDKNRYQNPEKDDGITFITALMGYMTYVFQWYPAMAGRYDSMLKATEPEARKIIETLVAHDKEINPLGCDGQGVYERSKRMLELMGFDPDKEEQDAKDKKKAAEQLSEIAKEFAKEIFKHFHTDRDVEEHATVTCAGLGSSPARLKEEKDKLSINVEIPPDWEGYKPTNWDHMKLTDYSRNPASTRPDHKTSQLVEKGMFLGTHIRKLLQTMSQTRTLHGLKRGKLAGKNTYRATMLQAGEYQRKIFKKKDYQVSLDVAISLVVDGSGSMRRVNKYEAASASAIIMSRVLTQLRIQHEIIVFTEVMGSPAPVLRHGIIKSFTKAAQPNQLMSNFQHFSDGGMSQNLDGESIMWSAMRLLKVDSKRKIMIVFSDGQPSAYTGGASKITTDAIRELEARRDMEIYGIGILTDSVSKYYKEYKVIGDIDELEKSLLSVIKSKIINK